MVTGRDGGARLGKSALDEQGDPKVHLLANAAAKR